jgi:hypothetical protein
MVRVKGAGTVAEGATAIFWETALRVTALGDFGQHLAGVEAERLGAAGFSITLARGYHGATRWVQLLMRAPL